MKTIIPIIIFLLISPTVIALGATPPYWKENPLVISSGEEVSFPILVQNMLGGENIYLTAEITDGNEIAFLIDDNKAYIIPFGRDDIKVNLKVKIPENPTTSEYKITLLFKQIPSNNKEMIQITQTLSITIPVIIKSPVASPIQPQTSIETTQTTQLNKQANYLFLLIISVPIILIIVVITTLIKLSRQYY